MRIGTTDLCSVLRNNLPDHLGKAIVGGGLILALLLFGSRGLVRRGKSIAAEGAVVAVHAIPDIKGYEEEQAAKRKAKLEKSNSREESAYVLSPVEEQIFTAFFFMLGSFFKLMGSAFKAMGSGVDVIGANVQESSPKAADKTASKLDGLQELYDLLHPSATYSEEKKRSEELSRKGHRSNSGFRPSELP